MQNYTNLIITLIDDNHNNIPNLILENSNYEIIKKKVNIIYKNDIDQNAINITSIIYYIFV